MDKYFLAHFAGFPRVRTIKNETHNKGKQSGQISTSEYEPGLI